MYAHPDYPFLTCSPDLVQTRPSVRLVKLQTCETHPIGLSDDVKAQVRVALAAGAGWSPSTSTFFAHQGPNFAAVLSHCRWWRS